MDNKEKKNNMENIEELLLKSFLIQLSKRVDQLEQEEENKKKQIIKLQEMQEMQKQQFSFFKEQQELIPLKENIENNLTFAEKVRTYRPLLTYENNITTTLGIRVPRRMKDDFLKFCKNKNLSARKVITYLVEKAFLDNP